MGIYFMMQRSKRSHQEIKLVPSMGADERRRRREHIAQAAEARVALMRDEAVVDREGNRSVQSLTSECMKKIDAPTVDEIAFAIPKSNQMKNQRQKQFNNTAQQKDDYISSRALKDNNKTTKKIASETKSSSNVLTPRKMPAEHISDHTSTDIASTTTESSISTRMKTRKYEAPLNKLPLAKASSDNSESISPQISTVPKIGQRAAPTLGSKDQSPADMTHAITIHLLLTSSPSTSKILLTISPECTATELRKVAAETTSVPLNEARLIYRGKVILDSTKRAKEYGVENGSVLHLVGKPRRDNNVDVNNQKGIVATTTAAESSGRAVHDVTGDVAHRLELESNSSNNSGDASIEDVQEKPFVHHSAAIGDIAILKNVATYHTHLLFDLDRNGWTPLHEAARAGQVEIVDFLIQQGMKNGVALNLFVNVTSNFGMGWSPLALAIQHHGENHSVVHLLRQAGGQVTYPRR